MAWIPVFDAQEPYVFDEQTGERIATCHKYQDMHEPPDHAWSRACILALGPELHGALAELVTHAKHHFPDNLSPAIVEADNALKKVKEFYDKRGTGQF